MLVAALLLAVAHSPGPDLELVGVVLSAARPVAVLRSGGRNRVATVGETAFGGRVVAIEAAGATLDFAGERRELRLSLQRAAQAVPSPPAAAAPARGERNSATRSVRVMTRQEVERRLTGELPRILAETSLVPVRRDGRIVGLTLSRIPEGSLLLDAGLHAGDVLARVNGVDIDGMASLVALWPRLQLATELEAQVLRLGEPFTVEVQLR